MPNRKVSSEIQNLLIILKQFKFTGGFIFESKTSSLEKQLEKALQQNELMSQNLTELTQQLKHVNEELALQRE